MKMAAFCQTIAYRLTFTLFSSSALTLLVRQQEGHLAFKKTGCWFVGGDDMTGALHNL